MKDKTPETKNKNMKIVIVGGSGLIGTKLVKLLRSGGHEVIAASPSLGINSITGEGLTEAFTEAQVVVDWNFSKLRPATCSPPR
jgi:nucleoside-diphosphate-sugar epimerase